MAFKFIIFAAFIAVSKAGLIPTASYAASPALKHGVQEEYDPHPQYSYGYDINDEVTGDVKSQKETRDGDVVQGSYSLIDADGMKRTVEYTADPEHGFNAVVHREPLHNSHSHAAPVAKYAVAPVAQYSSAPVSYAAPVSKYAAAPVSYAVPVTKYAAAPVSYAAPVTKYAAAPLAYAGPVAKYAAAPVAYTGPVAKYEAAPVAYPTLTKTVSYAAPVSYHH